MNSIVIVDFGRLNIASTIQVPKITREWPWSEGKTSMIDRKVTRPETNQEIIDRMNAYVKKHKIQVLNIETCFGGSTWGELAYLSNYHKDNMAGFRLHGLQPDQAPVQPPSGN
jgi:hypothetical protein